jgi:hypothetical protein
MEFNKHVGDKATSENGASGASVPVAGDVVIISSGNTVTVDGTAACGSLQIGSVNFNGGNGALVFNAGTQLTVSGAVTLGNGSNSRGSGALTMTLGGTLICGGLSSNRSSDSFTPGAGTIQLSASNSLPSADAAGIFDTFNNLIINNGTTTLGSNTLTTVNNLTVNGGTLIVSSSTTTRSVTATGGVTVSSGTLTLSSGSRTGTLTVGGDFTHSGGLINETGSSSGQITFAKNGTQTYTSGGTLTGAISFTVNSGSTLQMGTAAAPAVISNGATGTFTLSSGATLGITSPVGLVAGSAGNIQVAGSRSYSNGAGYIYNGNTAQVTGASLPTTVAAFNISNAAGVTLTNSLTVSSALTLVSGKIDASTRNLILSGTLTGGSASSYVITGNGVGTTTGTFTRPIPTGSTGGVLHIGTSSYYLPVTISNIAAAQNFTAFVFQGATTTGVSGTGTALDPTGIVNAVWSLSRSGTGNATIALKWDAALEGTKFATYVNSNIGISNYTTSWQLAAVPTITGDNTANTVGNTFSSFAHLGVGGVSVSLPVILVDFNAVLSGKSVGLSWTTQQEVNSSYFDIERSADGSSWNAISRVQAKGNAAYVSDYSAIDVAPLSGVNYYRLKMVDLDGRYGYTEIKLVRTSTISGLSVFPNPAKDYVNVSIGSSNAEITIRLFNQAGQVLQEKRVNGANSGIVSLPVHDYARGTYLLQVSSADGSQQTIKVLVTQ